jgi:predicted Zn-dependent protease
MISKTRSAHGGAKKIFQQCNKANKKITKSAFPFTTPPVHGRGVHLDTQSSLFYDSILPATAGHGNNQEFAMKDLPVDHNALTDLTRRDFLTLASISATGFLAGCAANPVTGKSQLMLMSEPQEIDIDKKNAPHQFSSDYGICRDKALNGYLGQVGTQMAANTHRPHMPYAFNCVNATYVNAYAFPGGSIAVTRAILLNLENEAELAALLGHELGHVNARHTAQRMSQGMITNALVSGVTALAGAQGQLYGDLAGKLGQLGAGALLASYSRDNEREADSLGLQYMTSSGYGTGGFVGLMDMLKNMSQHKSNAMALLFATHPMGEERYETALAAVETGYRRAKGQPLYKERYMDRTASLRAIRPAIENMQKGEAAMAKKDYPGAETHFKKALKTAPEDYAGLTMLCKCLLAQNKTDEAEKYAEKATRVDPGEAQARHLSGFAKIRKKDFAAALKEFDAYDRMLPGNPGTIFFKGLSLEGMGRPKASAQQYYRYLQTVRQGPQAKHAYTRLQKWGYVK